MRVKVDEVLSDPRDVLRRAICYPTGDEEGVAERLRELTGFGVEHLVFTKRRRSDPLPVLGKGHKGVAVLVERGGELFVAKILRSDTARDSLRHEAEMLMDANRIGVGPKLIAFGKLALLTEYVRGLSVDAWVEAMDEGSGRLRSMLLAVLQDCYVLDKAGIDHGELSRAAKHVIVAGDDRPVIIDFETASRVRRTANVTSIFNYLLVSGGTASKIRRLLRLSSPPIDAVRKYKHEKDEESFRELLVASNLT